MVHASPCPHCGRNIPPQHGPDPRCPACHAALTDAPLISAASASSIGAQVTVRRTTAASPHGSPPPPPGGYEELDLGPDPGAGSPPKPRPSHSRPGLSQSRPGLSQSQPGLSQSRPGLPSVAPRQPSESALAAARMANAPAFKAARRGGGLTWLPIAAGVILTLAITAWALSRAKSAAPAHAAPRPADEQVTIGRPPVPERAPVAEPEPAAPVVTRDLPPEDPPATAPAPARAPAAASPAPREPRKGAEREVARPARTAPPREVARAEKPAAARVVPAAAPVAASTPTPAPTPAPAAPPEPAATPPQFAAAAPSQPPTASAPLTIGPSSGRDGYQKAHQVRPGCVTGSLRLPRDVSGLGGESAMVKFQVDEAGAVSQYTYLSGPDDQRIASAIWAAIQRCEWAPGVSATGTPLTLWVTMPIRFGK